MHFERWKKVNLANLKRLFLGMLLNGDGTLWETHIALLAVQSDLSNTTAPYQITRYEAVPDNFTPSVWYSADAARKQRPPLVEGTKKMITGVIMVTLPSGTIYHKCIPTWHIGSCFEEVPLGITVQLINSNLNAGLRKKDRVHILTREMVVSEEEHEAMLAAVENMKLGKG